MELKQEHIDILEARGWSVCGYVDDGRVELEKYSPAGEDFIVCVEVKNFPRAVAEYAAEFDVDEHIAMWLEAKRNGVDGVPNTRELVQDAMDIDKMLDELADALMGTPKKEERRVLTKEELLDEMRFQMENWEKAANQRLKLHEPDAAREFMDKADGIRGVLDWVEIMEQEVVNNGV